MSGNLSQASTKGETSKPTSKTGYDRIDINKLFKGKTTEPAAKTVTQKHGMQTLGKAPPARRAGASVVVATPDPTPNNDVTNNSSVPLPLQQPPPPPSSLINLGQPISQQDQQKWMNSSHPHGPPPPMNASIVQRAGPPPQQQQHHHQHHHPRPDMAGNYQSQRFAQEFPSLEAGQSSDPPPRGSMTNSSQPGTATGPQNSSSKSHDNQYGPGPILRPQTGGREIQGGGRGGGPPRPGQHSQNPLLERPNLGGPTPPPQLVGPGGPAPPLGPYPMQFRGMAPQFMYPNGPGPGYYPQSGQSMPRYGMPVPPGAPPPREQHSDSHNREMNHRGGRPLPPLRPTQQFAVKPIIREEDMKRMDDIDQEGSWSSVRDEIDYNKKISFSDEDDENSSRKSAERNDDETRPTNRDKKPIRILERQQQGGPNNDRDREQHNRDRDRGDNNRFENVSQDQTKVGDEDWNNKGNRNSQQQQYDSKDRGGGGNRRGRDTREDDWRGSRFEEKKGPPPPRSDQQRGSADYGSGGAKHSNLPPRLLRQQQQHQPYTTTNQNQRRSPSPPPSDRDFQREREWENEKRSGTTATTQYRILERNRGDSESSSNSTRDKRTSNSEYNSRSTDNKESRGDKDRQSIESLKEKMEGMDVRGEKEDKSFGFAFARSAKFSTSSWADQVDDEDNARDYENYQKGLNMSSSSKPETVKEERTVPKRVYIQQRKVENMTTVKVEVQPESIKSTIEPIIKQHQQQQQDSSLDKNRSSSSAVWGERDEGEKIKSDDLLLLKETPSVPAEREIILSDKARQLHHNRDEQKSDKRSQEKELSRGERNADYDKGQGRYSSGNSNQEINESRHDREREKGWGSSRSNHTNNTATDRPRPGRWTSNDYRTDNRTPERDISSSGRSSATTTTDNSTSIKTSGGGGEGDRDRGHEVEKSRSSELIKETSPSSLDKETKGNRDFDKSGSYEKRKQQNAHEEDSGTKGSNQPRNRERIGHAVYQPRGGWGRQDDRGRGGIKSTRGGGRDYYDNNRPRRNEYDRERNEDRNPSKEDQQHHDIVDLEKSDKDSVISNEDKKDVGDEDKSITRSNKDGMAVGDPSKKGLKSPITNKRNNNNPRGGASGGRLHGYGPPSDKSPFSSGGGNVTKEEEPVVKEKVVDTTPPSKPNLPSSGPVPLMELGDISPPSMSMMAGRGHRHHGQRGKVTGGGMQQQQQQTSSSRQDSSYSSSRGNIGNKRGGGRGNDAKPLMSLNSNDLEKHEGDTEPDSQDDETKKMSKKRDSTKSNRNDQRNNSTTKEKPGSNTEPSNQDSSNNNNNNKGRMTKSNEMDTYHHHSGNANEMGTGSASDNSENVDSDGQPKKGASKEKLNYNSNKTGVRNEKQSQQQQQASRTDKDRRIKHPPYDAHSRSAVPPRFQHNKESNDNTWEKTQSSVGGVLKTDSNSSQQQQQQVSQPTQAEPNKMEFSSLPSSSSLAADLNKPPQPLTTSSSGISGINMDGGPLKTMIFENRNLKNLSKPAGSGKSNETKDSNNMSSTGLELTKEIGLSFGKESGSDGRDMDFVVSTFGDASQNMSSYSNPPKPIGPNRFQSQQHQSSPVSPLAKDLTEKIQAVRQVWDKPSMPSVAEQSSGGSVTVGSDDSNTFHSGFSDSFKTDISRDYTTSLQQPQSGYGQSSSPALAAISKPDSSTSPNSNSHRQIKPPQQQQQQQSSLENHVGMSSSPFTYSMPQQHQGTPFGGPSAIPSPPTAMVYGSSQALGGHTGVYQTFPQHVDSSQVMNNSARSQYGQYSNPQGTATTPYGLNTSIFMAAMDTGGYQPQMTSYQQHSHHQQQQHSQSGQGPTPSNLSNRSPGPMSSSGQNTGSGVMNSMKSSQQVGSGAHPMSHQVMGTASQQGYSQMTHHHTGGMPQHHQLPPVGHVPSKQSYSQSGLTTQSMYIPYDPSQQQVLSYGGQSYGMRNAPQGGPPPSATPPVQGMQGTSNYYSGNTTNQVFPGSNQASLQQLHVAVTSNPQALQNLQTATQQYGQQQFQITGYNQLQGYSQQAASTVSALNLAGQLIRPPTAHSHYNIKQGMDMVQQSHGGLKSHESIMNPTWNAQGFALNQGFHGGVNKPGGNTDNRNTGSSNIGNQRKGSHQQQQQQQMGNMGNMGSGVKYMAGSVGSSYSSQQQQQKGGRYSAPPPGPIQRPVSTSPGPIGAIRIPGVAMKTQPQPNDNKHMSSINQPSSISEEGLLDKFMSSQVPDPIMPPRLLDDNTNSSDRNGADNVTLKNHNLTISPANQSPITSSEK